MKHFNGMVWWKENGVMMYVQETNKTVPEEETIFHPTTPQYE
jgi:hypothetical protein